MFLDSQIEFSDAQAVTATAISTNVYDLFSVKAGAAAAADITSNTRLDIGTDDLFFVVSVPVAITDASSDATLAVTLESADDAALTTNAIVHYSTGTLAFAAYATAGTVLVQIRVPRGLYRRYLGVRYTIAAGPFTAGAIDAFMTPDLQLNRIYKSAFTVQ